MKRYALTALATVMALLPLLSRPEVAAAHPLGNFTVNRYSRLELSPERVRVRYVLDMAEIPTFQAMPALDANRDGVVSEAEKESYATKRLGELSRNLRLTLDGTPASLRVGAHELELLPGQGGLPTLRLSAWLEAPMGSALTRAGEAGVRLEYRDDNDPQRVGWREMLVRGAGGVVVTGADVPTRDVSDELRAYPEDLLSSPLDVRQLRFSFALSGSSGFRVPGSGLEVSDGAASSSAQTRNPERGTRNWERATPLVRANDGLAGLVTAGTLSLPIVLVALLTAMVLGSVHALSPGHGKTIVGAYLVGSRGTARDALFLGLTVTAVHTAGVFALGLATLYASQYVVPERIYPWLTLLSGLLVLAIGVSLVNARLRAAGWAVPLLATTHTHGGHAHSALSTQHSALVHSHSHGLGRHTHRIPGADGGPVTWRGLLALGISGGLLPCPSALVVMLGAIALHRVGFGLILIVAFSAGLAATLMAIGLLMVYSGRAIGRLRLAARLGAGARAITLARALPVASAVVVTGAGLALTVEAGRQLDVPQLVASARLWQSVATNWLALLLFAGLTLLSTLLLAQRSKPKWMHRV